MRRELAPGGQLLPKVHHGEGLVRQRQAGLQEPQRGAGLPHHAEEGGLCAEGAADNEHDGNDTHTHTTFLVFGLWPDGGCGVHAAARPRYSCPLCNFVLVYQQVSSSRILFFCVCVSVIFGSVSMKQIFH